MLIRKIIKFCIKKIKRNNLDNKFIIYEKSMQSSMRISCYKKLGKSQPTQYIFNQQNADHQLSNLLNLLIQFNSIFQLGEYKKSVQVTKKMNLVLAKIDNRHRSFWKVKSLVMGCCILVLFQFQSFDKAQQLIQEQIDCCFHINSEEYSAKVILFKILLQMVKPTNNVQQKLSAYKEVEANYKKFSKIKMDSSAAYFDSRLWQAFMLIEILVYQYILTVQKLAEFDEVKASYLYKKGLSITQRLLGKQHKFAIMMDRIIKIRRQTNRLLRIQSVDNVSNSLFKSTNKSGKFRNKTNKKLLKNTIAAKTAQNTHHDFFDQSNSYSIYKSKTMTNYSDKFWTVKKMKNNRKTESNDKAQLDNIHEAVSRFEEEDDVNEEKKKLKNIFSRKKKKDFMIKRGGFILNQESLIKQRQSKLNKIIQLKIGDSQLKSQEQPKQTITNSKFETIQQPRQLIKQTKSMQQQESPQQFEQKKISTQRNSKKWLIEKGKKQEGLQQSEWSCQII